MKVPSRESARQLPSILHPSKARLCPETAARQSSASTHTCRPYEALVECFLRLGAPPPPDRALSQPRSRVYHSSSER
ncbi:hypothetical protein RSAG8_12285, partial [Rhizoctonia solani AG-8 WAC10335]